MEGLSGVTKDSQYLRQKQIRYLLIIKKIDIQNEINYTAKI